MTATSEELFAQLGETFGASTIDDPWEMYARRRASEPVTDSDVLAELGLPSFASGGGTRPAYSLFRYADVTAALRDHETFANFIWMDLFIPLTGRSMLGMDGEEHRAWRGLVQPVFTRKAVGAWTESVMRPAAEQGVAELRAEGKAADLLDFAQRFPMRVIYEIIGLPGDLETYDHFQRLAITLLIGLAPPSDPSQAEAAMARFGAAIEASKELYELIEPIVTQRRADGATGDDLISHVIRSEFEGGSLDDEQITNFIRTLLPAATENTTRQFLNCATLLLERPADLDAVRRDRSLLRSALIEGERYDGPVAVLTRIATRDVEVQGVTIPEGAGVSLVVNSANRDEEAFPNADRFDIRRKGATPLVWGLGRHVCQGMTTARAEIQIAMEAMLDGLPGLRLDPDAPPPVIRGIHARGPGALKVVWD